MSKKKERVNWFVLFFGLWAVGAIIVIFVDALIKNQSDDPLYFNRDAKEWRLGMKESRTKQMFFPAYKEGNKWKNVMVGDRYYDFEDDMFYLGENIVPLAFDDSLRAVNWMRNRNDSFPELGGYRYNNDTEHDTAFYNKNVTEWRIRVTMRDFGNGLVKHFYPIYKEKGKWKDTRTYYEGFSDSLRTITWLNEHISRYAKIN